jgi:hypothetical protein
MYRGTEKDLAKNLVLFVMPEFSAGEPALDGFGDAAFVVGGNHRESFFEVIGRIFHDKAVCGPFQQIQIIIVVAD